MEHDQRAVDAPVDGLVGAAGAADPGIERQIVMAGADHGILEQRAVGAVEVEQQRGRGGGEHAEVGHLRARWQQLEFADARQRIAAAAVVQVQLPVDDIGRANQTQRAVGGDVAGDRRVVGDLVDRVCDVGGLRRRDGRAGRAQRQCRAQQLLVDNSGHDIPSVGSDCQMKISI